MLDRLKKYRIILGSKSPRRRDLLSGIITDFEIMIKETDESFPSNLRKEEIPVFLSKQKAKAFQKEINEKNILLITCDTIVWINDHALNKPENKSEAVKMLQELSGHKHDVFTGVTLTSKEKQISFFERTEVSFKPLSKDEIEYYIEKYKPYDKAGAYGVQEWMGYVGMNRIEGCFFNVMGLPLSKLYTELENF